MPEVVRLLISKDADLLAVDINGFGVVHWLIELHLAHTDVDELLLDREEELLPALERALPCARKRSSLRREELLSAQRREELFPVLG